MNLRLISNPHPLTDRVTRTMIDTAALRRMSIAEIRARYGDLEAVRDAISELLDKADGK
jgi:hypothetical protein